jgi:hypothetical protein
MFFVLPQASHAYGRGGRSGAPRAPQASVAFDLSVAQRFHAPLETDQVFFDAGLMVDNEFDSLFNIHPEFASQHQYRKRLGARQQDSPAP